jgi:hypothetical protein
LPACQWTRPRRHLAAAHGPSTGSGVSPRPGCNASSRSNNHGHDPGALGTSQGDVFVGARAGTGLAGS